VLRLGWLSTGRDKAARDLLTTVYEAIQRKEIKGRIAFVFSNREPGEDRESDLFLELVKSYKLPLVTFSSARFRSTSSPARRLEYDRQIMKRIARFRAELLVLAGYMLIVGEEMCQRFPMLNLHPAPPGGPRGTWQEVIWQLLRERAQGSGVMVHLVTPQLDQGPPVAYCTYPLRGGDLDPLWREVEKRPWEEITRTGEGLPLFQAIRREGLKREFPLILATLRALGEGDAKIKDGQVLDKNGRAIPGYDLTGEIEKALAERGSHG